MVRWELGGKAGEKVKGTIGWFDGNLKERAWKSERNDWLVCWELGGENERNDWLVWWELEGGSNENVEGMIGWFGGNLKGKRVKK